MLYCVKGFSGMRSFLTSEKCRTLRVNSHGFVEIKAAETQIYAQSLQF